MQIKSRILFTLFAFSLPFTACRKSAEQAAAQTGKSLNGDNRIKIQGTATNPDTLIRSFMQAVLNGKAKDAYAFLPNFKEYEAIYPHMPDSDTNPESPRMIATLMISSNGKELPRWLKTAEDFKSFSRYELGPRENHGAYQLIKQVKLFVRDSTGAELEFPLFRTLIEVDGVYKIWTLLEA